LFRVLNTPWQHELGYIYYIVRYYIVLIPNPLKMLKKFSHSFSFCIFLPFFFFFPFFLFPSFLFFLTFSLFPSNSFSFLFSCSFFFKFIPLPLFYTSPSFSFSFFSFSSLYSFLLNSLFLFFLFFCSPFLVFIIFKIFSLFLIFTSSSPFPFISCLKFPWC